jgi:hypothetical protein
MCMKLIEQYIASKANAWSPATLKSELHRLRSVADHLNGDAEALWAAIQHLKPYSRLTLWTRVTAFWADMFPNQPNPYDVFRRANANWFKNAYQRKKVPLTYEEAKALIYGISDAGVRGHALTILLSAVRYAESNQPAQPDGTLLGKGAKVRTDLRPDGAKPFERSYCTFLRALKASTGLTPHALRKLALTHAAERGAQAQDLMEMAGWSSIVTASWYLQPKRKETLKGFLR